MYNYDKTDLNSGVKRLVVCERLMSFPEYKPNIPEEFLQERDAILKEMEKEDLTFSRIRTSSERTNELIDFMQVFLNRNHNNK